MELWDLYDENRNRTGVTHIRGQKIPEGYFHLVVHVWISDGQGRYLISQRAENRPTYPLMWECVGGSVIAGEDSLAGALREAKEEVGAALKPEQGRLLFTRTRSVIGGRAHNDIMDVWLFRHEGEISLADATTDEVCQMRWMTVEEIRELDREGKLVENLRYFFTEVAGK